MSYTNSDIETKTRAMLGEVSEGDDGLLHFVCEAAASELEARLRRGVDREQIEELFVTAAGILALSLYTELSPTGTGGVKSFKAGELSVDLGELTSAAKLRKCAETMLSAYFDKGGFEFVGVNA